MAEPGTVNTGNGTGIADDHLASPVQTPTTAGSLSSKWRSMFKMGPRSSSGRGKERAAVSGPDGVFGSSVAQGSDGDSGAGQEDDGGINGADGTGVGGRDYNGR